MKLSSLYSPEWRALIATLKESRLEAGLTQAQLAAKLDVDQSTVSKIERSERRIDVVELKLICDALGISLRDFVDRFESAGRVGAGRNSRR